MKDSSKYNMNLELLFRNFSNIALIIMDNYNFNYVNRLGINLLGFKEGEIQKMNFIELLTPDSLEKCIDNIRTLRETGICQPFIVNMLKKNGEILSLELSGIKLNDNRFFFTGRNLSLERISKEKLKYLEEFNKNILNSIAEGIVVFDTQGSIIKFNDFMKRNFQWKKSEVIGKNAFELFPNLKQHGLLEAFVNIVDKGIYMNKNNIPGLGFSSGKSTVINLRGYPLKKGKEISGAVIIVEDITRSEEISKQIRKTVDIREKIQRIIESIMHCNTITEIINRLSLGMRDELGYERGVILLTSNGKENLSLMKLFSSINTKTEIKTASELITKNIRKGKGLTMKVFRTGKSIIVKNTEKEKSFLRIFPDTKSKMIVPIRTTDIPIGVITIDSRTINKFDETDLKFAEMLANSVGISIDKTRFFEDIHKKLHYLSTLYETSQMFQKAKHGKPNYDSILKQISQSIPGIASLIISFDKTGNSTVISSCGMVNEIKKIFANIPKIGKQITIEKIKNGNPFIADKIKKKRTAFFRKLLQKGIQSLYIFPFFTEDTLEGCLIILGDEQSILKKDQISLFTAMANQFSFN